MASLDGARVVDVFARRDRGPDPEIANFDVVTSGTHIDLN